MSKSHQISSNFWVDDYTSNLDPIEKLLFIYLLTSPHANIAGVYQLPIKAMAVDTGIESDMIAKILDRLSVDGKILYKNGWVAVKNRTKFNKIDNPLIEKGVRKIIGDSPDFIREFIEPESPSKPLDSPSTPHKDINTDLNKDLKPLNDNISMEGDLKVSLDALIAAYWEINPVWCKNAGRLGSAREEFHQQLLRGYSVDVLLSAIQKSPRGIKPWEIFKGSIWQKLPLAPGCLDPEDDYDEELYFDKTLNSWVCSNSEGLGMIRVVNEKYKPHKRGQPLVPDGGMYE